MLELTDAEREQLLGWERRRNSSQALALRSRIVLGCAEGRSNTDVAAACGVSAATVGKWRRRFCELRLDGLSDDPRPGRPATITAEQVEDVVVATLESVPENATHWSRAKMAQRSGLSPSTIGRIWRAFALKPHRADSFKLSNDPLFVEKVYDICGLYLNPPEMAVVLSVDEKSQVQALARSQPAFPMMPGMCEQRTHDYLRHGTTSLFAAYNIADGSVISSTHRRHRAIEFKKFLVKIDSQVPEHLASNHRGDAELGLIALSGRVWAVGEAGRRVFAVPRSRVGVFAVPRNRSGALGAAVIAGWSPGCWLVAAVLGSGPRGPGCGCQVSAGSARILVSAASQSVRQGQRAGR